MNTALYTALPPNRFKALWLEGAESVRRAFTRAEAARGGPEGREFMRSLDKHKSLFPETVGCFGGWHWFSRDVPFRERAEAGDKLAVSYRHRDVHLGYVPRQHRWIADAIDDGLRLLAIVETVKIGWIFRRRATSVRTWIVVLYDGVSEYRSKMRGGE